MAIDLTVAVQLMPVGAMCSC